VPGYQYDPTSCRLGTRYAERRVLYGNANRRRHGKRTYSGEIWIRVGLWMTYVVTANYDVEVLSTKVSHYVVN
jgi:hypothetical protein